MILELSAFFVAIAVLIFLAYKRISPMIFGPLATIILCAISQLPIIDSLLGPYMEATSDYIRRFFLVFMTGAIFGRVMADTGGAQSIAQTIIRIFGKRAAVPAVIATTAILTYGGVSLFVVIFVVYPLALVLFSEIDLTKRMIPGCVALGAFTFTMTSPGSPQIQNIIPISYLGTSATAGLIPGFAGAAAIAVIGTMYMMWKGKVEKRKNHTFEAQEEIKIIAENLPNFWLSLLPLVLILVMLNVFNLDVVVAVSLGILLVVILFYKRLKLMEWLKCLNDGAISSATVMLNTAMVVGFAGVVRLSPAFPVIVEWLEGMSGNPYIFVALSTTVLAGICGSASGGLGVTFTSLGDKFLSLGIAPEAIHRIASMAAGGLDSLPHCGAVISLLTVCGLSHRESYLDIFATTVVIPLIVVFCVVIPLCMALY